VAAAVAAADEAIAGQLRAAGAAVPPSLRPRESAALAAAEAAAVDEGTAHAAGALAALLRGVARPPPFVGGRLQYRRLARVEPHTAAERARVAADLRRLDMWRATEALRLQRAAAADTRSAAEADATTALRTRLAAEAAVAGGAPRAVLPFDATQLLAADAAAAAASLRVKSDAAAYATEAAARAAARTAADATAAAMAAADAARPCKAADAPSRHGAYAALALARMATGADGALLTYAHAELAAIVAAEAVLRPADAPHGFALRCADKASSLAQAADSSDDEGDGGGGMAETPGDASHLDVDAAHGADGFGVCDSALTAEGGWTSSGGGGAGGGGGGVSSRDSIGGGNASSSYGSAAPAHPSAAAHGALDAVGTGDTSMLSNTAGCAGHGGVQLDGALREALAFTYGVRANGSKHGYSRRRPCL
jgi:uncharacterized membrane protein YgcG